MLSERIDWTIERVDQALASLVGKELVLVSKYEGQEPIYRLNRQKLEEIKSRLASQNSEVRRQNSEG
jgi:DNA-binding transcriptional ArsR family regulator